jgi:hypothetical protein
MATDMMTLAGPAGSGIPTVLTIGTHDRDLLKLARKDQWIYLRNPSDHERESYYRLVENGILYRDEATCRQVESRGHILFVFSVDGAAFYEQFIKVFNGAKSNACEGQPSVIAVNIGCKSHIVDLA